MKCPLWLQKEYLRSVIFDDETPAGRRFDIVLTIAIAVSLIILFVESIPVLPLWLKISLGALEALLTVVFTIEYLARLYCAESRRGYALSGWGIIDLLAVLPPYLTYFLPGGIVTASFIDTTNDPVRNGRCPRCDAKVRKGDKFCSQCGEKL